MTLLAPGRALALRVVGYAAALAAPVALTYAVSWLRLPPFVFEHLVVLLVLGVAIPWGLGPAAVAAVASVLADNVLLREPIGRPTITGYRDVLDLALFAIVAVVVSGLVTRAQTARVVAQDAAERERRAREDRDRLIATVSHDLATPLSVLSGTVQLARQRSATSEVDWSRLLGRLETASARATSLVRTLSDAQALESDGFELDLAIHDLRTLVSPIVHMMDRFSERHPVILAVPDRPVLVRADADRLQRVLENLVNNAIKYSPGGGAVEVSVCSDDHQALLRVRDHGIGISPDALPKIFDRSYRAPEALAHAPGLGLGLSISAQVVAQHGGTIAAVPAEGTGTVVTVHLPRASQELDGADAGRAGHRVRA
ncbi:MAG: HAMP domain-containing histidine kinase [Acidobacteriota bacterium]|nr:HAMP domain-containing histidine kinase [Acidobacteriota bacterium]